MGNYQPTSDIWRHGFSAGLNINTQFNATGKWQIPTIYYPTSGIPLDAGFVPIELAVIMLNVQIVGYSAYTMPK